MGIAPFEGIASIDWKCLGGFDMKKLVSRPDGLYTEEGNF